MKCIGITCILNALFKDLGLRIERCFLQTKKTVNIMCVSCISLGFWRKIASDKCIGARNNHYKEFTYTGSNTFIIAMKMVHKKGRIGCYGSAYTRWGCSNSYPINIIVTGKLSV
jgi:hypothetical protein